jgi:hypothetical protein
VWSPTQPKFQTGAHWIVERPTATSCLDRCANSPEQAYPRPSPDAAMELARRYCLRRNSGRQCIRSEPLAVIPHLPDLLHRRSCRIPARTTAGYSHGPNRFACFLLRGLCAKGGHSCEPPNLSRGHSWKDSPSFVCFSCDFEKSYKITEKSENCKLYFAVLSETRTTTFPKDVYTFELQFLLEK